MSRFTGIATVDKANRFPKGASPSTTLGSSRVRQEEPGPVLHIPPEPGVGGTNVPTERPRPGR
ncbi:MAG: hypothetical protein OXC93_05220 [Rhodospirillaceae bacterium]|nr:hypothetical protein [Rhodospirillaceae bacterium]